MKYINYITHVRLDDDKEPSSFRMIGDFWVNNTYIKNRIKMGEEFVIILFDYSEWKITIGDNGELSLPPINDMSLIQSY